MSNAAAGENVVVAPSNEVRPYVPGETGTIADVVEQGPDLRSYTTGTTHDFRSTDDTPDLAVWLLPAAAVGVALAWGTRGSWKGLLMKIRRERAARAAMLVGVALGLFGAFYEGDKYSEFNQRVIENNGLLLFGGALALIGAWFWLESLERPRI
jgi:hypothetical protein